MKLEIVEGLDLTDILGVTKWEPPEDTGVYQNKKPKSWWWKLVYNWSILKMFRKKCGNGASSPHIVPKPTKRDCRHLAPDSWKHIKIYQ